MVVREINPCQQQHRFCDPTRGIEVAWKLHPNTSIEGAEISAIAKALEWIRNLD